MSSADSTSGSKSPSLLDRVSAAIHDATVAQLRDKIKDITYDLNHIDSVFTVASSESDRASAILIFALIDDILFDCFKREINPAIRGGAMSVLGRTAPLATADARIQVAAGLYWIGKDVYQDVNQIRKIRNAFAHKASIHSFADPPIVTHLNLMTPSETRVSDINSEIAAALVGLPRKKLFEVRAAFVVAQLLTQLIVGPSARLHNLSINVFSSFDNAPENLKDIRRIAARIIVRLLGLGGAVKDSS